MATMFKSPAVGTYATFHPFCRSAVLQRRPVVCKAQQHEFGHTGNGQAAGLRLLGAGFAAAVLLAASPACAGVKFTQPVVKKVFQSDASPQAPVKAAAKAAAGGGPSFSLPSFSLDAGSIALPGAVAGIGGLGFLASKVDTGFADFFNAAIAKDSTGYAGYEQALKSANGALPKGAARKASKVGKKLFGGKK